MALVDLNVKPEYSEPSEYSYCPCIYLSEEQCEALGISGAIDAGTVIGLKLRAVVTRSTTSIDNAGDDDGPDVSLALEVTHGEIIAPPAATEGATAAKALYGGADTD